MNMISAPISESISALSRQALLDAWREAKGHAPPLHLSTELLRYGLAYQLQAAATGGLSKRVTDALQQSRRPGATAPARKPRSGSLLVREWNGVPHHVEIVDDGYRYRDLVYRSLTAIAYEITGAKWSGPRFFGLKARSGA